MTDKTTELLKNYAFALRRLEYAVDKPGSNMTLGEYEAEEKRITDEHAQAITATLGSEREKALEELVRDIWREITTCPDYSVPPCMTNSICERVRNLGIEVN